MTKHTDTIRPIKNIVVSSKVGGNDDLEKFNKDAIYKLHKEAYTVANSNGEELFSLTNLEDKIVKAGDAFLFLPIPKEIRHLHQRPKEELFREIFKAASLLVGKQTGDPNLLLDPTNPESPQKPIIFVNHNGCWDGLINLANNLHHLGTMTQAPGSLFHVVHKISEAIDILKDAWNHKRHVSSHTTTHKKINPADENDPDEKSKPDFNVCVFCSASTKNPELLDLAYDMGSKIAGEGWGVISGLGCTGMMGKVVEGAANIIKKEQKGWIAGSNLPRIINMEGLPSYYDKLWLTDDIYKRMEVMIKNSQAFVLLPGGMGTVQELMALLLLKYADKNGSNLMHDRKFGNKPIILVNPEVTDNEGKKIEFWKPLIEMAKNFGFSNDITVVNSAEEAKEALDNVHTRHDRVAAKAR